jgi:predicted N-acetyltransferase YhbS
MKEADQQGGCLCGAVRYRFAAPSTWCAHVHHAALQRAFGAAAVTVTAVRSDRLVIETGEALLHGVDVGTFGTKRFCASCGTPLFLASGQWPEQVHVVSATLDGGPMRRPSANLFVDQAAPWARIDSALAGFGGDGGNEAFGIPSVRERAARFQPGVRLATQWDHLDVVDLVAARLLEHGNSSVEPGLSDALRTTLAADEHWLAVADLGSIPAGYLDVRRTRSPFAATETVVIADLYVLPSARRKGVARRLVGFAEALAADLGAAEVSAHGAPALFSALGFAPSATGGWSKSPGVLGRQAR